MRRGSIAVLVFTVVAMIIAGFLVVSKTNLINRSAKLSVNQNQDPEFWRGTKCSKPSGSVDSGVYKNSDAGFSVNIPQDWKYTEFCHERDLYQIDFEAPDDGELVSNDPSCLPCHSYVREFRVEIKNSSKSLSELENDLKNSHFKTEEIIQINGVQAFKVTGVPFSGLVDILVSNKSKTYYISHLEFVEANNVDNPKYTKQFEDFLQSFKFI